MESNKQRRGMVVQRVMEPGITVCLPGTESTGFSPVGHIVNQIVDGLKEQNGKGKDDEGMVDSRWAVDRGVSHAGIRAGSAARGGGMMRATQGDNPISGKGSNLTARAVSI